MRFWRTWTRIRLPRRTLQITKGTIIRSEQETIRAIERYSDTVRRICAVHLKNDADTEDIFQTVFLKYVLVCFF